MKSKAFLVFSVVFLLVLTGAPAMAQLNTYLTPSQVSVYMGSQPVPPDIAATTWEPKETDWWLSPPLATVLSVPGPDGFGGTPFMLGSPTAYSGPFNPSIIPVTPGEDWRIGYLKLKLIGDGKQLVAFLVKLPPGWDSLHPTAGIDRMIQLASGSGDCRARSSVGDLAGFDPAGVLFFVFDQRYLTQALDAPGSPGHHAFEEGKDYLYDSIGVHRDVPWNVLGYSAGGAAALNAWFVDAVGKAQAVASISPILVSWSPYHNPHYLTPPAPAPANPWAALFALGTTNPAIYRPYYGNTIVPLLKATIPQEVYEKDIAFRRLARGDRPKAPLLIVAGSNDDLGAGRMVLPLFMFTAHWNVAAYPVFYTQADVTAGRAIDFPAIAAAIAENPRKGDVVGVLIDQGTHGLVNYGVDSRAVTLAFFESIQ